MTLVRGSEMAFIIRFTAGQYPKLSIGPPGSELGCYIPDGVHWTQRHHGQAEGLVEVEGREWGFRWYQPGDLAVILERGEMNATDAMAFIRAVGERIAGTDGFQVIIAGDRFEGVIKTPRP